MAKATVTVEGFIANDLEVRQAGTHRVVEVRVPVTPQKRDVSTGEYTDSGDTIWYRASFWDEHVNPVLETVGKKDLVTVTGTPKLNVYTKADGTTTVSIDVDFPTIAKIVRRPARNSTGSASQRPAAASTGQPGTPGGFNGFGGLGGGNQDEPWARATGSDEVPF